jgi:hypothetical protein
LADVKKRLKAHGGKFFSLYRRGGLGKLGTNGRGNRSTSRPNAMLFRLMYTGKQKLSPQTALRLGKEMSNARSGCSYVDPLWENMAKSFFLLALGKTASASAPP